MCKYRNKMANSCINIALILRICGIFLLLQRECGGDGWYLCHKIHHNDKYFVKSYSLKPKANKLHRPGRSAIVIKNDK